MKTTTWTLGLLFVLTACGTVQQPQKPVAPEDASDDEEYAANLVEDGTSADEEDAKDTEEGAKFDKELVKSVLDTVFGVSKKVDLEVATCGGFGDEAKALQEKIESLKDSKTKPEDAKDEVKPLADALFAKLKETDKETIKACHDKVAATDLGKAQIALMESCWTKPEGAEGPKDGVGPKPGEGPEGQGPGKGPHGKGPKGPKPVGPVLRLPPKDAAQFDSDACKAAVSSAQSYL